MWLCSGSECGILLNDDMQPVDIAPDYAGGGDTARDVAHEMAEERAHDRAHEQAQRDNRYGYL